MRQPKTDSIGNQRKKNTSNKNAKINNLNPKFPRPAIFFLLISQSKFHTMNILGKMYDFFHFLVAVETVPFFSWRTNKLSQSQTSSPCSITSKLNYK